MTTHTIQLEPALDIAHVGQLKAALSACPEDCEALIFDAQAVERVDAAGLQLLLAFVRQCQSRPITVSWASASTTLADGAAGLGLAQALQLQLPNLED